MNKKTAIALSGILLAASLILPVYLLTESSTEDVTQLNQFLQQNPLPADDTAIQQFISATQARHQRLFAILLTAELILAVLFAVTLWFGFKT